MNYCAGLMAGTILLVAVCEASGADRRPDVSAGRQSQTDATRLRDVITAHGHDASSHMRWRIDRAALKQIRTSGRTLELVVPIDSDAPVAMRLQRFEVTTSQTKFITAGAGGAFLLEAPRVSLWRGDVAQAPGSHVFLALNELGGTMGNVSLNGRRFEIASEQIDDAHETLIVRPSGGDLPEFDHFCSVIPAPQTIGATGPSTGSSQWAGPRVLNLAVDGDQAYVNLFPSGNVASAQAYIVSVLGAVSDIFMRDLDMKIVLRFSRVWPDGGEPFSATDVAGFRQYWINNEDLTGINLVHLFSGRRDTGYGGIAYLTNACSSFGFGISAFLLGQFPSPVVPPGGAHLWNWDVSVIAHELGHNLGSPHTHDYSPPIDTCTTGPSQRGTIMSYCHATAGGMLNTDMNMHTRVAAVIAANHAPTDCLWHDCNGNAVDDAEDILNGTSIDSDGDGVPDECQDCNGNGILDSLDIAGGEPDINGNGRPDSCEIDCNGNGVPDAWEVLFGIAEDVNGNGILDSCEPDCDGNGRADFLDILDGTHVDLDRNSVPDACQDCNKNGVPDWIDIDRAFNVFITQTTASGSVREYHAKSGVLVHDVGVSAVNTAYDAAFGQDRQLYVASFGDHRIVKINVDTGTATDFVANHKDLMNPTTLAFGPDGNLYAAGQIAANIVRFTPDGVSLGTFVPAGSGGLTDPRDIAFGPNGNLFVISGPDQILQFNGSNGSFVGVFAANPSAGLNNPRSLLFLPSGQLLVTNYDGDRITRYGSSGEFLGKFNDAYPLPSPWSIALGPNGNVFAAQTNSNIRVIEYDVKTGLYLRSFVRADQGLNSPTAIAFRPASPNDVNRNGIPDVCEPAICLADVSPGGGDGVVNANDLLAIINAWGPCPLGCSPPCSADVTFDCIVNVNDLLAVINAWGPCS